MADRQDETEDSSSDLTRLDRRTFLGTAAAGVAATATVGTGITAATGQPSNVIDLGNEGLSNGDTIDPYLDDYWTEGNEVHIPEGEYGLNDGDSLGIDASDHAWLVGDGDVVLNGDPNDFNVYSSGSAHVRLQNLTLTGEADSDGVNVRAEDSDGVVEFINFNMPNGGQGSAAYHDNPHAGVARWINCHIEAWDSDGIYASSFAEGDSNDGMGTVEVYGGLYKDCDVQCIRIGGDNSKVVGATIVCNEDPGNGEYGAIRGIRVREAGENQQIIDCDFTVAEDGLFGPAIHIADTNFEGPGPSDVTVDNCRFRNEGGDPVVSTKSDDFDVSGDTLHISGGGSYELEGAGPYSNVVTGSDADSPTTQKRWYDWDGSNTSDSDSTDSGSTEHHLDINAATGSGILYTLTVDGTLTGGTEADLDKNDTITDNGDGTYTATGEVVDGYTDDWNYTGEVLDWSTEQHPDFSSADYELVLDGSVISPDELDPDAVVKTQSPTEIASSNATLNGELTDLGEASSATVYFEYGKVGNGLPNTAGTEELTSTSTFSQEITGLDSGVEYEYRAVAEASDGDTDAGSTVTLTTSDSTDSGSTEHHLDINAATGSGILYTLTVDGTLTGGTEADLDKNDTITDNGDGTYTATGEVVDGYTDDWNYTGEVLDWSTEQHPDFSSADYELVLDGSVISPDELDGSSSSDSTSGDNAPVIDYYEVTEAGSPNPHADIVASWEVSDADSDLASVLVQVIDSSGNVVDASLVNVSGGSLADVRYFQIKKVKGQTFDVKLTVKDEAGNSATETQTVSER